MTAAHIHLMVVHLPVVGCPLVLALLVLGHLLREDLLLRVGYGLLVMCAAFGAMAYYSGPSAYELLEARLAPEKAWVEHHAVLARVAFVGLVLLGVVAAQALLQFFQEEPPARALRLGILVGTAVLCYLLAWSAHAGGQIGHPEIREGLTWLFPGP
ncbi:MAG: DUF2231 domain-containing protein [Acidobacteriota bacterium]